MRDFYTFLSICVSVGASGAIFGLLGAQWADYLQNYAFFHELDKLAFGGVSGFLMLFLTTTVLVGYSLIPALNAFAHLFGLFTGSLMGYILLIRPRVEVEFDKIKTDSEGNEVLLKRTFGQKVRVYLAGFTIFIELLVFATLFGVDDVYEACEYCKYLQCFNTPAWDCDDYLVASCSFEPFGNINVCTNLDPDFEGDCVLITCLDGSVHPFDSFSQPTAADCYQVCGPDHSNCRDD